MAKESTHRAQELKDLGWSNDDVVRYAELWDYRQRWGAINLERDDRQFLRKAEAALPKILTNKTSIKKPINEKSYYQRICFFLEAMNQAENKLGLAKGSRGMWPILLEEELRALDYYEPVLGLPDTIKAKGLEPVREEIVKSASESIEALQLLTFDFHKPLDVLKTKESTRWRPLREGIETKDQNYPVLSQIAVDDFRKEARSQLVTVIRETLPSLAESEKPYPPEDWSNQ